MRGLPQPNEVFGNVTYTSEVYGYNYDLRLCYPRRMVDFNRNGMLFSSGDSPSYINDPFGG
jgi:hypothetical protein